MRNLFLAAMLLFSSIAWCEDKEPPQSEWTFEYEAPTRDIQYSLGLVKPPKDFKKMSPSKEFLSLQRGEDGVYPKSFHLKERAELTPIKNQGACGSCVYFATTAAFEDDLRLRGLKTDILSPQYLMDCAQRQWMCGGSFFEYVADGLAKKGGAALLSEYPYRASNQSCQGNPTLHGKIVGYKLIDSSPKSIIAALNASHAVPVTVGAGGSWMGYRSGIFNACSNVGTNHQVVIVGYDCESAVDENGNCKFDANGKLPNGVGIWHMRNSWGTSWGEQGYMRTKMTSASGAKCNNLTEEAGILDIGVEPEPPKPPQPPVPPSPTPGGIPGWLLLILGAMGGAAVIGVVTWIVNANKAK